MTLIRHELRQGRKALAIWAACIGLMIAVCVFLFPEMKQQMEVVNRLFASMGAFTAAFGMDRLNFGTLIGFYAVECGNILGMGGAFFSSLTAAGALAKEERDKTAEFLLTHPISRARIVTQKLIAVLLQIVILNAVVYAAAAASIALTGEPIPWRELSLLHFAHFLLQIELAGICLGISAFLRRGELGAGIGIAAAMYCLNLIANVSRAASALKLITPFAYAEGADIIADGALNTARILLGMCYCVIGIAAAYWKYTKKDIH